MVDLSISRFQQTATQAADGAKLRLDSSGEMSTAKRSWIGRLVRFIGGPTQQDRADTKQLMSGLLSQLKARYGDAVGIKAFLAARPGAQLTDGGGVRADVAKPLTARQVRDAISYAEARTAKHAQQDLSSRADRFAPGTDRFASLLQEKGLRSGDLGQSEEQYFASRLRDDVAARSVRDGAPPDTSTVKKLASRLLDHVRALGEDEAAVANRRYKAADRLVADVALALAGPGATRSDRLPSPSGSDAPGLATLLTELLQSGDDLVADLMRGSDVTRVTFSPESLRTAGLGDAGGLGELRRDVMTAIDIRAEAISIAEEQQQRELEERHAALDRLAAAVGRKDRLVDRRQLLEPGRQTGLGGHPRGDHPLSWGRPGNASFGLVRQNMRRRPPGVRPRGRRGASATTTRGVLGLFPDPARMPRSVTDASPYRPGRGSGWCGRAGPARAASRPAGPAGPGWPAGSRNRGQGAARRSDARPPGRTWCAPGGGSGAR